MLDFEVQRCTRRCANTDRELQPGEAIYSALIAQGSQVTRYDYSVESWESAPPEAIGVWKSQIPEANSKKLNWAPNDVMLDYFTRIENDAAHQDTRFVLALLLLRRRLVRQEGTETDPANREVMLLQGTRDDSEHRVIVVSPTPERIVEIQTELAQLLMGGGTP